MSPLNQINQPVIHDNKCPVFDCKNNKDFVCKTKKGKMGEEEELSAISIGGPVYNPSCVIEELTVLPTSRKFVLSKHGLSYIFLSYIPGQGLFSGLFEGRGIELYAVKYNKGQLSKVDFYHDKVLKWIPKDESLLPGFEIEERIHING